MSCSSPTRRLVGVLALVSLCTPTAAATAPSIQLDDLTRLRTIESVDVSRDGGLVVCSVLEPCDGLQPVRRLSLLNLVRPDASPIQLTTGDRDDRHPVFGPDSRRVAFLRRSGDGSHQVHVMPVAGGESMALAALPGGVDPSVAPVWSPDGSRLLVTGWIRSEVEPGPVTSRIGDAPMFVDPRSPRRGLWMLDPSGDAGEAVGPLSDFEDCSEGVFAADGRGIYCTVTLSEEPEPGRPRRTAIGYIGLGAADAMAVQNQRMLFEDSDHDLWSPRVAPSGDVVAVLGRSRRSPFFEPIRLGVFELDGTASAAPSWLTGAEGFDRSVLSFGWRAGQDSLLLNAYDDGGVDLLTISRTLLSQPRVLVDHEDDLPVGINAYASGGGVIAMNRCAVDAPSELWVLDGAGMRRLWNPNAWLDDRTPVVPTTGWVTPRGEDPIPYWLYRPEGIEDGAAVPIVVWLGDGAGSMLGPGLYEDWFATQLLAADGCAVLQVNPRGSAGYGREVRRRAYRDLVRGPSRDVFAVLQHVRQEHQGLGAGGQAVMGRGLGGLLGVWMLAAMPSIDAAVFEDGVFSVSVGLAEHPDWHVLQELLGGLPQDPAVLSIMRDIDPAAHVDRIEASVLLLTGTTGGFVTELDTQAIYRMLSLGYKDVELVVYPTDPAGGRCTGRSERYGRILEYLDGRLERP